VSTNLLLHTKFKNTSPAYISFTMKSQQMDCILPSTTLPTFQNNNSSIDQSLQTVHDVSTRISKQVIIEKMKLLLESAKNKTLRLSDFMAALMETSTKSRKSLGALVAFLRKGGFVRTFDVHNHEKGKGLVTCIQMLKAFPIGDNKIDSTPFGSTTSKSYFLLKADLPLEMQIYKLILERGSIGITSSELMHHLSPFLSYKAVMKVLGILQGQCRSTKTVKKTGLAYIKSVHDFDGKMRLSRYFAVDVVSPAREGKSKKKGKEKVASNFAIPIGIQDDDAAGEKVKGDPVQDNISLDGECNHCKKLLDLNMRQEPSSSIHIAGFCSKECETLFLVNKTTATVSAKPAIHGRKHFLPHLDRSMTHPFFCGHSFL
jgi:hypothetical protein